MPKLISVATGTEYELPRERDSMLLGRSSDADLPLSKHNTLVSAFHVAIYLHDGQYRALDLSSLGTKLNDVPMPRTNINWKDKLSGGGLIRFKEELRAPEKRERWAPYSVALEHDDILTLPETVEFRVSTD